MPGREGVSEVEDGEDEADELAQRHHQRDGEGGALRGEDEDAADADVSGGEGGGKEGNGAEKGGWPGFGNVKSWEMDNLSLGMEEFKILSSRLSVSTALRPGDSLDLADFS